jgi:hypothetical protein
MNDGEVPVVVNVLAFTADDLARYEASEFDAFDVVIHSHHWVDARLAYVTTYNRPAGAANDCRYSEDIA